MAIRTRFSSLDMVRMAKFAKENTELKPIPLIKAYCEKFPEITEEQKLANIRNWLHDNDIVRRAETSNECAALPIQHVVVSFCPKCNSENIRAIVGNITWECRDCYHHWAI